MKNLTKKEVQKRVMETMAEIFSNSGMMTRSEARKGIRAAFEESPSEKDFIQGVIATMFYEYAEREIKQIVKKGCNEKTLEPILAQIKENGRGLPTMLRNGLNGIRKKLPRRGGPGRERALTPTQAIQACEYIALEIKTKKLGLPDIFESVAETFRHRNIEVSAQTIKRVWGKRDSLYTA